MMITHPLLLRRTFISMHLLLHLLLLFSCGPGWQQSQMIGTVACFEHLPLPPPPHQLPFPSLPSSNRGNEILFAIVRKNNNGITLAPTTSKTTPMAGMSTMTLTSTSLHTSSKPINDNDHDEDDENDNNLDLNFFQQELARRRRRDNDGGGADDGDMNDVDDDTIENAQDNITNTESEENEVSFDGYDFRDIIYSKWGECFDVDFQRVDSYGFRNVYLVSYISFTG